MTHRRAPLPYEFLPDTPRFVVLSDDVQESKQLDEQAKADPGAIDEQRLASDMV